MQKPIRPFIDRSEVKPCLWISNSPIATSAPWEQRKQGEEPHRVDIKIDKCISSPRPYGTRQKKDLAFVCSTVEQQSCSESATSTLVLPKSVPAQSYSSAAVMLQVYAAPYSAVTALRAEVYWSWPVLPASQVPQLLSEYWCCIEVHTTKAGRDT